MNKWELCYVRPPVTGGAEVIFFHPDIEKNHQYRNLKDFVKERKLSEGYFTHLATIISHLLSEGWEPLNIGGGSVGKFAPDPPDFGATGYAFRRLVASIEV